VELDEILSGGGPVVDDLAWAPVWDQDDERIVPIVRCPFGHVAGIRTHKVAADGKVTPSIVCDGGTEREACRFHDWLVLEEWDPEWRPEQRAVFYRRMSGVGRQLYMECVVPFPVCDRWQLPAPITEEPWIPESGIDRTPPSPILFVRERDQRGEPIRDGRGRWIYVEERVE